MDEIIFELKDVYKYYKLPRRSIFKRREIVEAVRGISFNIKKGMAFALVGESGCGKSTTAKLMVRMEEPTSGEIKYHGINVNKNGNITHELSKKVQIVMQNPFSSLPPHLKIRQLLIEPLKIHNITDKLEQEERLEEAIKRTGLDHGDLERFPSAFSGGYRQMISIARAIILRPEIVVLDEATSALDNTVQAEILNLFHDLKSVFNFTYIVISHDLGVVRHMCDFVGVMYLGKFVEKGSNKVLFSNPKHPYTKSLIASIPTIEKGLNGIKPKSIEGEVPSAINPPKGCAFSSRCVYKTGICEKEEPQLITITEDHAVACHNVDAVAKMSVL